MKPRFWFKGPLFWGCVIGIYLIGLGNGVLAGNATLNLKYDDLGPLILKQNGAVQSAALSISAAQARKDFVKRARGPQLSGTVAGLGFQSGGGDGVRFQPEGSLDFILPISRGVQDDVEEGIRQAQVGLAQVQLTRTVAEELSEAQDLYWELVYSDEMGRNLEETLGQNARSYASAKHRFKRGLLTQTDLLGFEIYKSQLEEGIESLHHEKKILLIRMNAVLGFSDGTVIGVSEKLLPHPHDQIVKESLSLDRSIEIEELTLGETIVSLQTDKIRGKSHPVIDLFATDALHSELDRSSSNWADRTDVTIGIRGQFLFFDGNQIQSEVQSGLLKSKAHSAELTYRKQRLTAEVKASQEELIHLHELFHHSESRLIQSKKFLQSTLQDYDRGIKDSTDVVTAMQLRQEVQGDYATQKKQYQKIKTALLARFDLGYRNRVKE